ncbi:MAG: PorP/SprF family type IX secretion system membrane protein [Bacteroidetes bacterium]|nr:PorP/SprF family type IX secretion system membrane protein [Bacteroidota bacterium]
METTRNKICIVIFGISSLLFLKVKAQDIHFSEFNENPSLVNPALTGQTHIIKASVIYRDQWRSVTVPYKTFGASVEMKLKASNWDKVGDHATLKYKKAFGRTAAGLSFFSDKAGDGNMGTSQANLSFASFIPVSSKGSLSLGLQASVVQRKVDYTKLLWNDQYGSAGYDNTMDPGETFTTGNFIYPDFAAGILYSYGFNEKAIGANNQFKMDVGFSMYHLNTPKQKYLAETSERLLAKYIVHGKFLIGIKNTNLSIVPSYIFQLQGSTKEFIAGSMFRYNLKEDSKYTGYVKGATISLGAFYRNKDAMIACAQIEFSQYAIGCSYDINTSGLTKASTSRGGFEIFLKFVTPSPYLYQNKNKAKFN